MPLRDHFRPPLLNQRHWESFYSTWPVLIVADLHQKLPSRFFAEVHVHSGRNVEIDVATGFPNRDVYEVLVYDEANQRSLVAAIEIVSPANKDRPEHRQAFVAKCGAYLQQRVSVVLIDIVTTRTQNLYAELLDFLGHTESAPSSESLYAAACRATNSDDDWQIEAWYETLTHQQTLPTMPLWLADNLAVPLELEASYEQSCRILNLP